MKKSIFYYLVLMLMVLVEPAFTIGHFQYQGKSTVFTCRYMFYACDPCAQYKVIKVMDGCTFLKGKDIILKFSTKQEQEIGEDNIAGKNLTFKIWGEIISDKGKDLYPNETWVIKVKKMQFLK